MHDHNGCILCYLVKPHIYLHSLLNKGDLKNLHGTGTVVGIFVQHSIHWVQGRQNTTLLFGRYGVDSCVSATHLRKSCLSCVLK